MNRQSPAFCVMPHMGLAIQNKGDLCACNINSKSYNLDGKVQTIDNITVDQIWQSPTRLELAKRLDDGIRDDSCRVCWETESTGKESVRQQLNKTFGHLEPDLDQPRLLILKPGNTCNAACRICGPDTSTSWYRDAYELEKKKNPDLRFNSYIKNFESIKDSFNPASPNMWPIMDNWYEKLKFIDIYGGEPFMIPGLWKSLQQAIDKGYSKDIDLRISTNGSHWNEEYMTLLSRFKSVDIGISIDSHVEEEFEYMRNKLVYSNVIENAKQIIGFVSQNKNMNSRIYCTISIMNVWNINEIVTSLGNMLKTDVNFTNFVYFPGHHDIRHLPRAVKQLIVDKLRHAKKLSPIIDQMNQIIPGCQMYWPKFCLETEKIDSVRNQNFKDIFPEWYKILEPYWDYKRPHHDWYGSCNIN